IVVVECGNEDTGGFDDFDAVADLAESHVAGGDPTWVHVDGTFMLLAAASSAMAGAGAGLNPLHSRSADSHPVLRGPGDGGLAICRPAATDTSRGAYGVAFYTTLRALGRDGMTELVERITRLARRFAESLRASGHAEIVNDVVSNQILVRWLDADP